MEEGNCPPNEIEYKHGVKALESRRDTQNKYRRIVMPSRAPDVFNPQCVFEEGDWL